MNPILETIISLVFIFLILSLITSWIVEYLSMINQRRGIMLYKYLKEVLGDNFNKNWGLLLYAHPMIEALSREIPKSSEFFSFLRNSRLGVRKRFPQYIPADQFSKALIDIIIDNGQTSGFLKNEEGKYITVKEKVSPDLSFEGFTQGLSLLKESEVKNTLEALTRSAASSSHPYLALCELIENWYNNGMDRLNGWYKRATRKWLFFTGLLLAALFNINALVVITHLYKSPQLRASVVQSATVYLEQHKELDMPTNESNLDSAKNKIAELQKVLAPFELPFGYELEDSHITSILSKQYWKHIKEAIPKNIFGWLLTAYILSFGAPFWFDVLKRLVNVRSSGLAPDTKHSPKNL